ncbi:MAG: hydrogenase nickel incorporation protein HypB [Rhodocyclaceae bacterium]|nr:hydrogenase nickel incorporation protein HypB [Rhodocyclaceae bacterium]
MCVTCGCGSGETRIEGQALDHDHSHEHTHVHADGTVHSHAHDHGHEAHGDAHRHEHGPLAAEAHEHEHVHADGTVHRHGHVHAGEHEHPHGEAMQAAHDHVHAHPDGTTHGHAHLHQGDHVHVHDRGDAHPYRPAQAQAGGAVHSHAPGVSQARMLKIEQDILAKNDAYAAGNRRLLAERGVFAVNLVSSPGSGKTTLLVKTIQALGGEMPAAVIEGDQQTALDADRIRATGAPAIQVNTGKGCHLDAHMVGHALESLPMAEDGLLFIENVGNLVCPAAFDLGEAHKVAILSVTEGEDKPLKYPDMFQAADLMILNKVDLLPHLSFDADQAEAYAKRVNPAIRVLRLSATTGEGMEAWLEFLRQGLAAARGRRLETVESLKRRVAELERQLAAKA